MRINIETEKNKEKRTVRKPNEKSRKKRKNNVTQKVFYTFFFLFSFGIKRI
jgi:hypothetical protein